MGKNAKKSPRTQARKADVKDLAVKDSAAVKGGKVAVHDISITKFVDKSSPLQG
jgi:type VI protein secretion system component Hcp